MSLKSNLTNPLVHVVQGTGGVFLGIILLFTPWYQWGMIITPLSAIFFLFGLSRYSHAFSQTTPPQPYELTNELPRSTQSTVSNETPRPDEQERSSSDNLHGESSAHVKQWYQARNNKDKLGPFTFDELQQRIARGELKPEDMLLRVGNRFWQPTSTVRGLLGVPQSPPAKPAEPSTTPAKVEKSSYFGMPMIRGFLFILILAIAHANKESSRQSPPPPPPPASKVTNPPVGFDIRRDGDVRVGGIALEFGHELPA